MQKKKVISAASFSAKTHSEVFAPKPSVNSIPAEGGDVNRKFSLKDMDGAYMEAVERGDTDAAQKGKCPEALQIKKSRGNVVFPRFSLWRSGRDSNPRAAFDDNTISSRARYDLFDTTAYSIC